MSNKQGVSGSISSAQGSISTAGEGQSRNDAQREHIINSKSERAPIMNQHEAILISEREKLK